MFVPKRKVVVLSMLSLGVIFIAISSYEIGLGTTNLSYRETPPRISRQSLPSSTTIFTKNSTAISIQNSTSISSSHPEVPVCEPVTNIVFIKTHKTGGTSLHCLLFRFGYHRNLSFVLNINNTHNGHFRGFLLLPKHLENSLEPPIGVKKGDYANYKFDMFLNHVVYAREAMDTFMKGEAKYISILREPGVQIESHINFFGYFGAWKDIERFARSPSRFNNGGKTFCRNNQFRFFGPTLEQTENEHFVRQKILQLDEEFDLILIAEYFDESLILLKKLLCWEFNDIVYLRKNTRVEAKPVSDALRNKIYKWSKADVLLYNHFNRTLWNKIESYGPSFWEDLDHFRRRREEVTSPCVDDKPIVLKNQAAMVREFRAKNDSGELCDDLVRQGVDWYPFVAARQRPEELNKKKDH